MQLLIADVLVSHLRYHGRDCEIRAYEKGTVTILGEGATTTETVDSSRVLHGAHWLSWLEKDGVVSVPTP